MGGISSSPPADAQSCSAAYPDFCIPPPPPDVDCGSAVIADRKNFTALAPDPHNLDANNDGVACEDPEQPRFPTTTIVVVPPADPIPAPTTPTTSAGGTAIIPVTTTTVAGQTPATVRQAAPAAPRRAAVALTG